MKPLLQAMKERRLYLDGGMGSMLQAAGLPEGPTWKPAAA